MSARLLLTLIAVGVCQPCLAQEPAADNAEAAVRQRIEAYVSAFNAGDVAAIVQFWAPDGVSVAEETGERTEGREALQAEFTDFFAANSSARLTGQIDNVRMIRVDVAEIEGRTNLFVDDAAPVQSAFTAIVVKEDDNWLISSSHERDLPSPSSSYEALKELEWLIGTWEDQSDSNQVTTTVRWSPSQAFLLRSFTAQFAEAEALEGTQVIGWDALNKQIRTWTFHSDGSFGQGTLSKHDDAWMLKMWQVLGDGQLATGTKIMTRIDENTLTVQTIGETVDGQPVPSTDPVTVVRTIESSTDGSEGEQP